MLRGTRRWGPVLAAVLSGVFGSGAVPASGAEPSSPTAAKRRPLGISARSESTLADSDLRTYTLRVDAVAYHLPGRTASGLPVRKGVVAVDPELIPLGTRLFVPGYGKAVAADVGVAINGRIIDLWMPNDDQARKWGRKTVVITIYS